MWPTRAEGMSCAIPSTMPSPARRIGTRVSFFPGNLPAGHPLERRLDLHRLGREVLGDLVGHQRGDLAHQLLEVAGAGVPIPEDRELVSDERMGEDSQVRK